jgi:hypothetical protein
MPIDDAQLTGTANQVKTGATLTVQSGATLTVATGGTATAPAWFLNTFTASTISAGQNGLGWDENGRVTLQTPVGALQFYTTGSPSESVIYWPGRIVTNSVDAGTLIGSLSASSITAPLGSESIDLPIIARSVLSPMSEWIGLQGYAGANGIPYVTDAQGLGNSLEATDGVYFPQAVVSGQSTSTSYYQGRYRTATQVKADLGLDLARTVTSTGSITSSDAVIICTGAGGITLTLPAANALSPTSAFFELSH